MIEETRIAAVKSFGAQVDFGKAAADYGRFRAGFPDAFFQRLSDQIGPFDGKTVLDVGTGAGTVARGLARIGAIVTGIDPSTSLMAEAEKLGAAEGVSVTYREGRAEALPFADWAFDIVTAGQCWHWFDRPRAASEAMRVLKPGGSLAIAHFDWLPLPGNVVAATEAMILAANPAWKMSGGVGVYPHWLTDMGRAGFTDIETRSFDVMQPYSHEAWRGRIRASAGVKASLDADAVARFDAAHADMLRAGFPDEPLMIPHRVWWVIGRKPV